MLQRHKNTLKIIVNVKFFIFVRNLMGITMHPENHFYHVINPIVQS